MQTAIGWRNQISVRVLQPLSSNGERKREKVGVEKEKRHER
uniref:Uncharacterized protein n=1 Tax=Romanomermis culicivorax TaxID=13658 RepID=A0A915KAB6_ROMCU